MLNILSPRYPNGETIYRKGFKFRVTEHNYDGIFVTWRSIHGRRAENGRFQKALFEILNDSCRKDGFLFEFDSSLSTLCAAAKLRRRYTVTYEEFQDIFDVLVTEYFEDNFYDTVRAWKKNTSFGL